MSEATDIANAIQSLGPRVAAGSLRFWGVWFGPPYDNVHHAVGASHDGDLVTIRFDLNEVLSVWTPSDWVISEYAFRIVRASRVRWEWFDYGRPQTPENLAYLDLSRTADGFELSSNWASYMSGETGRDPDAPAVKMYREEPLVSTRRHY